MGFIWRKPGSRWTRTTRYCTKWSMVKPCQNCHYVGNSRDLVKAWFPVPKTKTEIDGDFLPRSSFEGTIPDSSGKPKRYHPYMLHVWTSWSLFIDIFPEDINIFPQRYQHFPQRPENLWPVPVGPMQFPTVVGHSLDSWTVPCWEDPLQNPAVASLEVRLGYDLGGVGYLPRQCLYPGGIYIYYVYI